MGAHGVDVVAIHGINAERCLRREMLTAWRTAMVAGLENVRSTRASTLSLDLGFYGHEYNDGEKAVGEPPFTAADLKQGLETELAIAIGESLIATDGVEEDKKLYLPGSLQRALVALQGSELFGGQVAGLISFVKQVSRYFDDTGFRARVHAEVAAAMGAAPRVVIGHSLGSVIAYDWLQHNRTDPEPVLVTIGSPLGLEAIRARLDRPPNRSRWPGEVRSWTNIAAHHDAVAMVKQLRPLYHPYVLDQPCDNPRKTAHSAEEYLRNVRVARALRAELG